MGSGDMPGTGQCISRALLAPALLLALLSAGCSGGSATSGGPAASAAPSAPSSFSSFFSNSSAKAPQTVAGAQPDVNCPRVEIRRGASTLSIGSDGGTSALTLKYQGSFAREARECAVVDGNMVMRVGVEGRVVIGPQGVPGQVDVPLRLAVVQEIPGGMRPIATKFLVVPVTIPPAAGYAIFSHIEEGITFPLPTPTSELDDYIVYIGFDPVTAEAQAKAPPKVRPKPKPKPSANAT